MKLTDALATQRAFADQTHKFWGYYQAFTAAAIAFAWSNTASEKAIVLLTVVYAIFAGFNCRLVYLSQKSALDVWNAVQRYMKANIESIPSQFLEIPAFNKPDEPSRIRLVHIAFSVTAALIMLARLCFPQAIRHIT